ncbi:FecR family protein [Flavobacterium segetis]|uniref:FecR family protein n=1 Tax=Flavobacterium segetis TaxID=271157 RepID=A0A1M5E817_9FLAO|nr:FecR family protein [Flavobacterium segetis]SHF75403.1 FecR family protein [Flavobacterium segetis]
MQDRNNFTDIEDFLSNESFRRWVRFQVDDEKWEDWTLEDPQRAKLVEEARLWILAMNISENSVSKLEIERAIENTWNKINNKASKLAETAEDSSYFWKNNWVRSAAAVIVFGMLGSWFYQQNDFLSNSSPIYNELIAENLEGLVEQTNNSNKPQIINLSDGSSVLLQPNSKLSYPKIFIGKERKVYLSGEGFFEISKNPKKPFFVFANEIVTKVLGTSFRIRAYDNQPNIEIIVRTGKVKIISNNTVAKFNKDEIELLPNEALRFVRKNLEFNKITDITTDTTLSSSNNTIEKLSFNFSDTPVAQILKTIEQAYLVDIDFPIEKLKNCHLTTSLNDQPLPEKLKIICRSLGNNTSYEMNGNQITISSEGCD